MMQLIRLLDPVQRIAQRGLFSARTHCWLIVPPRACDKTNTWRMQMCQLLSSTRKSLFGIQIAVHYCCACTILIYPIAAALVWVTGWSESHQSARGIPQRPLNTCDMIQHADLSIAHLHAWTWPNMSPMHWDSSNSRSLRICNSKTNISHSTSKNCFKPEETMLFCRSVLNQPKYYFRARAIIQ